VLDRVREHRIVRAADGRVRCHDVLLDCLVTLAARRVETGSGALAVQRRGPSVTEGLESMVRRAFALEAERRREERR
jgi:hypothetical protein